MSVQTETFHAGAFIVSEANGMRSRDVVTIASGEGELDPGTVIGKVTVGAVTSGTATGNTGNGTIATVSAGAGVDAGIYRISCIEPATNGGVFLVENPDGINLGAAVVGTAFTGDVNFTLLDGSTDFVAGDSLLVTVAAGSGKYKLREVSATDGSQVAAGVLFDTVDATSADAKGVAILRDAEVNEAMLVHFTGATGTDLTSAITELASKGIIAR